VLRDRGEDANACVRALGELDPARKTFAWMAALAVEEYRIESALCQAEHQATPYDEQLPPVLAEWLAIVEEAGASWGPDKAVPIIQTTSEIITRCAYVAAEEHFGTPLKAAVTESEEWRYLVGDCWPRLLAVMKDLPCADVSLSEDELTSKVRDVAALVQEWCDAIGFELSSEDGDLCVMPLNEVASLAA
jgi:hypothetical protein